LPRSAHAFTFSDGSVVRCTAYNGRFVDETYLPPFAAQANMGYTGVTLARPDGSTTTTWDTARLSALPPAVHDYIYFHECAHAHVPTSDELVANCVGLVDMRAAGRSSAAIEQQLAAFHASLGYMGPRY